MRVLRAFAFVSMFVLGVWFSLSGSSEPENVAAHNPDPIVLGPGESRSLTCASGCVGQISGNSAYVAGATLTPTATATRTPTATATATPTTVLNVDNLWHAPTTHEHGDEPPAWVTGSALAPTFEGTEAHVGFKGFLLAPVNGVDGYVLVHLISTPTGRATQHHTVKVWLRDPTGAVSYYQGLLNTGDPATTRVSRSQPDPGFRPIVLVVDQAAYDAHGPQCEVWYTFMTSPGPAINWLICPPVYLHDSTDTVNPATWTLVPGGGLGLQRTAEIAWYDGNQPEGAYTNALGQSQYTAPTLKNYAVEQYGLRQLFFRTDRVYSCPSCVAAN